MNFSVYNNTFPIDQFYAGFPQNNGIRVPLPQQKDSISVNRELEKFLSVNNVREMITANPVITKLLKEEGLTPEINIENFKKTTYNHSLKTRDFAAGIYNNLPIDLKSTADISYIQEGALLHDIGKVLIPARILNKQGQLTEDEARIMHLHSRLSAEMLSTQNIKPEVLNIVKYHHQNKQHTGYPELKNTNLGFDINTEIVSLADKFSALKEARSYKKSLTDEEALEILKTSADKGEIDYRIYNSLVGYINSTKAANSANPSATIV